ncbi:MAG: M20 aminoacylase family protein [Pseudomonadota bacterium]
MTLPLPNSIVAMSEDLQAWRRDLHAHPELGYEEHRTARLVAERLRAFGLDDVEEGVGRTGVVGVLHGRSGPGGPVILLRADMDALPITEATGAEHASATPGVMHACGHDGHTTMLLGAARHLAETRGFEGTVCFCFQPAEESGAGAKAMIDDGLLARHKPRAVYGLHNWPGLPVGQMAVKEGPVLAAADEFKITLTGRGGHAAEPHLARDTLLAGAWLVTQLQTVVARLINPRESAVISVTEFLAGHTHNVIPGTASLRGTTRCYDAGIGETIRTEMARLAEMVAAAHGVEAMLSYGPVPYPATINDGAEARFAHSVMKTVLGAENAHFGHPPSMASEDFSFLANEVPGAFAIIGNGETAALHHPGYDFDDAAAPVGVAYWVRLVETALTAKPG